MFLLLAVSISTMEPLATARSEVRNELQTELALRWAEKKAINLLKVRFHKIKTVEELEAYFDITEEVEKLLEGVKLKEQPEDILDRVKQVEWQIDIFIDRLHARFEEIMRSEARIKEAA